MIGDSLTRSKMETILRRMQNLDHPWECEKRRMEMNGEGSQLRKIQTRLRGTHRGNSIPRIQIIVTNK